MQVMRMKSCFQVFFIELVLQVAKLWSLLSDGINNVLVHLELVASMNSIAFNAVNDTHYISKKVDSCSPRHYKKTKFYVICKRQVIKFGINFHSTWSNMRNTNRYSNQSNFDPNACNPNINETHFQERGNDFANVLNLNFIRSPFSIYNDCCFYF